MATPARQLVCAEPAAGAVGVADTPRTEVPRRSILFVRSVALPIALKALAALRSRNPDARISVLTNDASARALEASGHVDEVLRYSPTRFGIVAAGLGPLRSLRARRFDLVLVPYAGRSWSPFWNVGRFGVALQGRDTRWLPAEIDPARDLASCEQVSFTAWARTMSPGRRARFALVAILKWPTLLTATLAGLLILASIAPLLYLLVRLTPSPENVHGA